jgi:YidC/Oxa1 family membrane protein insertase
MVITSYFMTKMTPTPTAAADPAQQKMMALMPVFMGFIFINLSSGLNLYYFSSNLIGVVQQWYLNRSQPLPSRSKFKSKKKE